jgi:steroid delta-isomerase-like uncharacterized protein
MDQNTIVLKKFLNAEIKRDVESMAVCLHEDFILHVVGTSELVQGKLNFLNIMRKVFEQLKDWNLGIIRMIGSGDSIVVEFDGAGHFSGEFEGQQYSSVPIKIQSICVFDFKDGLIKKCAEYYDSWTFKQQLIQDND